MFLYHYYDKEIGPFKNLSDLSGEEANEVLQKIIKTKPHVQCAKRNADYMELRIYYENILIQRVFGMRHKFLKLF